jgi:hypothetical protein
MTRVTYEMPSLLTCWMITWFPDHQLFEVSLKDSETVPLTLCLDGGRWGEDKGKMTGIY